MIALMIACSEVDKAVRFLFLEILMLVLLLMLYDCFNGCVYACSLSIMALIFFLKNHCWYLQIYSLISISLSFGCL
jgi:hypothetical protein